MTRLLKYSKQIGEHLIAYDLRSMACSHDFSHKCQALELEPLTCLSGLHYFLEDIADFEVNHKLKVLGRTSG